MRVQPDDSIFRARAHFAGQEGRRDNWPSLPIVVWLSGALLAMAAALFCGILIFLTPPLAIIFLPPLVAGLFCNDKKLPVKAWLLMTAGFMVFTAFTEYASGMRLLTYFFAVVAIPIYGTKFIHRQLTSNRSLIDQSRVLIQELGAPHMRNENEQIQLRGPKGANRG
jgi:hypothetical protein